MPGASGTETRALSGQVLVRLPEATAVRVSALALAEGLSASAWARRCLVAAAGCEPADAVPIRAKAAPRPPAPEHVLQIAALRHLVAELGGSMTQAAIKTRIEGADALHAEIEALIPGVKAAVRDLDALKAALLQEAAEAAR